MSFHAAATARKIPPAVRDGNPASVTHNRPSGAGSLPMAIKAQVDTLEGVPEALHEHYTEKDGKFVLQAEGLAPIEKVDSFRKNNIDLMRQVDELRTRYDGIDPEKFRALTELEHNIKGKKLIEEGKFHEALQLQQEAMRTDAEKQRAILAKQIKDLEKEVHARDKRLESHVVDGAIIEGAREANVKAAAFDDIRLRGRQVWRMVDGKSVAMEGDSPLYGKDGNPISMNEWMLNLSEKAPHLFEPSTGTGARGSTTGSHGERLYTRAAFDPMDAKTKRAVIQEIRDGKAKLVD